MGKLASVKQRKKPSATIASNKEVVASNRKLLAWLDEWYKTPPLYDKAWWDDFEHELRENRLKLRHSS